MSSFQCHEEHVESTLTLQFIEPSVIDRGWQYILHHKLQNVLLQENVSTLILNMENVQIVDGCFAGVLIDAYKAANQQHVSLQQTNVSDGIMEAYRLLKVDSLFFKQESAI